MDLVNIVYRYINRFINSEQLVKSLENIDKSNFTKKETLELDKLLDEVKNIINTVPIEIDQIEINRRDSLNGVLKKLDELKTSEIAEEKTKDYADKRYNDLLFDMEEIRDSGPRYEKLEDLLLHNSVYINYREKMDDLELLNLIAQYFSSPVVPNITQETFNNLVKAGIKADKREALWRLAFNYYNKDKDFSSIEDYFIEKRDVYYLVELIVAVEEDLNMEKLIEKVINTHDRDFIIRCGNEAKHSFIFTDEEIEKLKERIDKNI